MSDCEKCKELKEKLNQIMNKYYDLFDKYEKVIIMADKFLNEQTEINRKHQMSIIDSAVSGLRKKVIDFRKKVNKDG